MDHRLVAAKVIGDVLKGASLSRALPQRVETIAPVDKPKIQALVYGVLRHYERLSFFASKLLSKPPRARDDIVRVLLLIGIFELDDDRTPPHAVVNGLVKTARSQRKWAAGLVNACLRRYQREKTELLAIAEKDLEARAGMPSWLAERLEKAWPKNFENTIKAISLPPPMTLRVNQQQGSREDYQQALRELGIESTVHPCVESALTLSAPVDVGMLPGFEGGAVSVQDAAAQLAAEVLGAQAGMRVLDACAAPGGKTAHIIESVKGNVALTALEFDELRSKRIDQTLERVGLEANVIVTDAGDLAHWWDGQPFDRVLLDAPCSATGTIRRNPDIKRHRKVTDIDSLVGQQQRLLDKLWETVAGGGMLVYATCSIIPEENDAQVAAFVAKQKDAEVISLKGEWGHDLQCGKQILPGEHGMDGFYYSCLMKH